jgi:hypothetical protein
MFEKLFVQEALKRSWPLNSRLELTRENSPDDNDSETSLLIYDIFGGEILKTSKKSGWHFYNRIQGERVDFTRPAIVNASKDNHFEDLPVSPDETYKYFEEDDYSNFFIKFVSAYEEIIGLSK